MAFSVGFAFLESEKEDSVTWVEVCKTMLKDKKNAKVIVIDRNTTLMNSTAKVFPTFYALLCRYHIIKNVRSKPKYEVGTKQIKGEDEKMAKAGVELEIIMNVWNGVINSSTEELYEESVIHFRRVYARYPYFLK